MIRIHDETPQAGGLDEVDLDLVAALQFAPRAGLRLLARALEVSVGTVSRRFARLRDSGRLRVVGQITWSALSDTHPQHIWITTDPGAADHVANEVAELAEARFVAVTTGETDVFCILHAERRADMSELLRTRLPAIAGVSRTRTELGLQRYAAGTDWRLGRLSIEQVELLRTEAIETVEAPEAPRFGTDELAAVRLLEGDGRATAADVARETGVSASTAYRVTQSLLRSGVVVPRVDIEPALLGYPLEVVVSLVADPGTMEQLAETLARQSSARYVTTVAGRSSVIYHGLFRHEIDLARFLGRDIAALPGVSAFDLSVVLQVVKRYWKRRDLTPHAPPDGGSAAE